MTNVAIENGPVEIVVLPIDSMVHLSSSFCDSLPEGTHLFPGFQPSKVVQDFATIHRSIYSL